MLIPKMVRLAIFLVVSAILAIISRRPLRNPTSHGFYRFLVFETILVLVLLNLPFWFRDPLSPHQLFSWLLLAASIFMVLDGAHMLKKFGGHQPRRENPENFAFENTVRIVSTGIYRYIRHPMYSSLLLLAWGAALKHLDDLTLAGAVLTSFLLIITAKVEERECRLFFGESYRCYRRRTRMFIPFLF